MGLFTADLYRNFAIGFAAGAVAIAVQIGPATLAQFAVQSVAALV